jgi:glutaredoxin
MEAQTAQRLKVYWRPGCSSCVRVKEFLTGLNIPFESIDVSARPEAMEDLLKFGVRTVPVVARGAEYVFAQELADVSQFVGRKVEFRRMPAPALVERWLHVLDSAQRYVLQIPQARLAERATPGRDRSIRDLAYHIFQVPDSFLQALQDGVKDLTSVYNAPPPPSVKTSQDICIYGSAVTKKLAQWWKTAPDKSCGGTIDVYYGVQPLHHVLERCTWHSAQHTRQIISVLQNFGVSVDRPLTDKDYAGLPMPAGLWT